MSTRARVVVLIAIAAISLTSFVLLYPSTGAPAASRPPEPSPRATLLPPIADAVTHMDHAFDPRVVPSPTGSKAQSKLWYSNGAWWGLMHEPASDELHIYRLDDEGARWVDTNTLVDERPLARGDALAVGDQVYVATVGRRDRPTDAIRLNRFTFRDGAYRLDPDFPVVLSDTGSESVVVTQDTTGRLWISYVLRQRVWVRASTIDDHHWGEAFVPAVDGTNVAPDDISAIVAFGGSVGVMWSNQNTDAVYFSEHRDEDPVETWGLAEIVSSGEKQPDDHINMKADEDGRVYAALKTSLNTRANVNALAPQIVLVVRDRAGVWREHVVARIKDRHTRPIVLIDEQRREVYVVATAPAVGGSIYYKRSSLDRVSFETGVGSVLIQSPDDPRISNATSSKQSVNFESGLVVLASDNSTARYLHGVLEIGGERQGPPPPPLPPASEPRLVVNDTFDSWRDGEPLPDGWTERDVGPDGATIRSRTGHGRVARIASVIDGPPPRVCRGLVPTVDGHARIDYAIRNRGLGRSEAVMGLVRGSGGDALQLRFGSRGTFAVFRAGRREDTTARWATDRWYRVTLDLDIRARRTSVAITDEASGDELLRLAGIDWPAGKAMTVDEVCFSPMAGSAAPSIELDDLLISQSIVAP